ncbi:hypothetical protein LPAF129_16470 [Ligilactobacillus pabuli]|uniref:Uncharacterized protein n=1 Tax=Ligilactobacillus pabuli TaxID=2886039 RepID=A0ABQ5JJ58_9LACO|nr:hypothetical protein [Ligilactobacillus pabuli]GKS81961.1 hypothetical protein LPAF129_16470 [Ligilactobacillus pabuli]
MDRTLQSIKNMQLELDKIQQKLTNLEASLKFEQHTLKAPLNKIITDLDSLVDLEYNLVLIQQGDLSTSLNDLTFIDQFIDLIISHLMHIQRNTNVKLSRQQDETISDINQNLMHVQGSLMIVMNSFNLDTESS